MCKRVCKTVAEVQMCPNPFLVYATVHGTRESASLHLRKEKSLDFQNPCGNFSKQLSEGKLLVFARGLTFFEWEVSFFEHHLNVLWIF